MRQDSFTYFWGKVKRTKHQVMTINALRSWDPLSNAEEDDIGLLISAQRREIQNILKSYTGYFDLFAELAQNALDAVEKRIEEGDDFKPSIIMTINLEKSSVKVVDNGCAMNLDQIKRFVKPNFSFKKGETRGNKGVGATYLAYGFNFLEVQSKIGSAVHTGVLKDGRTWVEDSSGTVSRPKFESSATKDEDFEKLDRGTLIRVQLSGSNIRPKKLNWLSANTASNWEPILRVTTPFGGLYFESENSPEVDIEIRVIAADKTMTSVILKKPEYYFPHTVIPNSADIREFLSWQSKRVENSEDVSKVPAKFTKLNGIWGYWTGEEILENKSPINLRLSSEETEVFKELGIKVYIYLGYSTELWDTLNDKKIGIRQGHRLLRGGLQLGTRQMPQGTPLTIPMTNNIGFQNLAHVIVHMDNAEPDLGRKGFQPEHVSIAEKVSVSAVTALRKQADKLKKPGAAKLFGDNLDLSKWIKSQEEHEQKKPLVIKGKGLFLPTEELPIRSEPIVEQDVVALFNQMLSSGLVRGIQLISSSQYKQYDGLYRVLMDEPFDRYEYSELNPLGIDSGHFAKGDALETPVRILEYKHSLNGLIEEFQTSMKAADNVNLAIAWELGTKWKEMFDITSYLIKGNVHHRQIHGTTHSFTHSMSGAHAFEVIILQDLINYLTNQEEEEKSQIEKYDSGDEW